MIRPILRLGLAFALAFGLVSATAGYWAVARQAELLERADNPRRLLLERRFPRGAIYDRNGAILAESRGTPGDYARYYPYPALAPVLGYVSPLYGTAGVEAAADDALHGDESDDAWTRWWRDAIGLPRTGRAVQLTLDLDLQRLADEALGDRVGAVVLLEAASGEILALASHPTFDPNTLDENWESLVADAGAPLLNRATFALYQPGGALQPALLGAALQSRLADLDTVYGAESALALDAGLTLTCRQAPSRPELALREALTLGCPGPFAELGQRLGALRLEQLFTDLRLLEAPEIGLPTAAAAPDFSDPAALAAGQGALTITPLHLALVTAALTQRGELPAPSLLRAVAGPAGEWQPVPPADHAVAVFAPETAETIKGLLRIGHSAEALSGREGRRLAWFSGFAPLTDTRFVVTVMLEDGDTAAARQIGQVLLVEAVLSAP